MKLAIALTVLVAACALAETSVLCHNYTGTCLEAGFHCANKQVVPHAQRCDGIEDCLDGTDEYMCHEDGKVPLHLRSEEERTAATQGGCAFCECLATVMSVDEIDPWFSYAKNAPTDTTLMSTGSGQQCHNFCIKKIALALYKKSGVCRGWLCCMRQRECLECRDPDVIGACYGVTTSNRCVPT